MKKIAVVIIVAVIFPFTLNFAAYFGFISGYTTDTFSENSFKDHYYNDIYKYRIISSHSIVELNHILENGKYKENYKNLSRQLQFLDKDATVTFYLAFFIWNTLFLILSLIAFYFLLNNILKLESITVITGTIILNFLIVFTQFIIVPYDNFSYFFEILFIIFVFYNPTPTLPASREGESKTNPTQTLPTREGLKTNHFLTPSPVGRVGVGYELVGVRWLALPAIMIISTLNRESSAVNLSFLAAILFYHHKYDFKKWITAILPPVLAFLLVYFGVRFILGFDTISIKTAPLLGNIKSPYSIIGSVFWISSIYILFVTGNSLSGEINKYFLLFSIPYIITCFISGVLFEYRLLVPILIGMIVINMKYRGNFNYQHKALSI
jgi:hypothetical protein